MVLQWEIIRTEKGTGSRVPYQTMEEERRKEETSYYSNNGSIKKGGGIKAGKYSGTNKETRA